MLGAVALASMGAGGCDENERLADYAKNSVDQQSRQNDQIARQNQEVTQQNRQVAEAARNLVEADARARQELVTAQQSLQSGLQAERATLDQQRTELEQDRKDIARDRYWQPVIAETLHSLGVLAACLAPLLLCVYVLRNLSTAQADETALNELLVSELVSETPRLLLPAPDARRTLVDESPVTGFDVPVEPDCGGGAAHGS
ncbi:MAG: hypothetical protein HY290_02465, partial [Planctomycetia bacterium]|nr:hypothetical protein [Planctomycetia bacterium]